MPLPRRTFLGAAAAVIGATVVPADFASGQPVGPFFAHGIASGDPLPDGILLWTRVTPTADSMPGSANGPIVVVRWQMATDATFGTIAAAGAVTTGPNRDHTVKIDVSGLQPATDYWYRFLLSDDAVSPTGRTRTAPARSAQLDHLRLGVVSCSNWEAGYFSSYRHLAQRGDIDLIVHLGDYLYEYRSGEFANRGRPVRPCQPANELLTLADYRIRHAQYKTDPDAQALHAALPWVVVWDDHEVSNDAWSGGAQNHDPATEGPWAARAAAAHQAYTEWMPVRFGANGQIYRRLQFGNLAELSMLDLRTYRSKQAAGTAVDDPDRTITGDGQMSWLKQGLAASTTRWRLIGNPVMISRLDFGALPAWLLGPLAKLLGIPSNGLVLSPDQWDGYNADRNELVDFMQSNSIGNVVFLTGDIHTSWANELTTKSTVLSPTAVEFVVPSVTSDNLDDFLDVAPGTISPYAADLLRASNWHVKWAELDRHGFAVFDIRPQRCQMDWYFVSDRKDRNATTRRAASWQVSNGSSRLRKV
ncbi:alkaline phosphatase D family protein [Streptomyces sp. SID13031]|uniref:alkaline phosphatase D family protein n=1 Tax=Streptomyces sp. SID13031 TaxID=2706046 RepID=UPI0013CB775F|nr:alkaline phosphatase D family protein [Streptomyces sp. SID13031]NEA37350.1 alkaline phosphatase [Streptomyces sp. SID13031]